MGDSLTLLGVSSAPVITPGGYSQHYQIEIDHTMVPNTDRTNYVDYVFMSNANLKTVANGGLIQHTVSFNGQTVPADLVFSSDSGGSSLYTWDIEFYDGVNGILGAHVQVGSVSHTTNTTYHVNYGNTSVTTYQGGSVGAAYPSPYKGVWHMSDGTTLSLLDSTANGNNGTGSSVTAQAGMLDGGIGLASASSASVDLGNNSSLKPTSQITVSLWINYTSAVANTRGTNDWHSDASQDRFIMPFANATLFGWYIKSAGGLENGIFVLYSTATWYLIHGTYNGATGTIEFFVNGVSQGTLPGFASTMNTNSKSVYLGKQLDPGADSFFNGKMDEYRIIDAVLTADDCLTEYNNQNNPGNIGSAGFHIFT